MFKVWQSIQTSLWPKVPHDVAYRGETIHMQCMISFLELTGGGHGGYSKVFASVTMLSGMCICPPL